MIHEIHARSSTGNVTSSESMCRYVFLGLVLLSISALAAGEEESSRLRTGVYRLPPSYFPDRDDKSQGRTTDPSGGTDAREYLNTLGVPLQEGSEALYFKQGSVLFLRATPDEMDLLDALLGGCGFGAPILIQTQISLISFQSRNERFEEHPQGEAGLRKIAGESWKEVSRLDVVAKSGVKHTISAGAKKKAGAKTQSVQAPLATWAAETIVGPDGFTMDMNFAFEYFGDASEGAKPLNIRQTGSTTLWDGSSQVVMITTDPGSTTAYALIVRASITLPDSSPLKKALAPAAQSKEP